MVINLSTYIEEGRGVRAHWGGLKKASISAATTRIMAQGAIFSLSIEVNILFHGFFFHRNSTAVYLYKH